MFKFALAAGAVATAVATWGAVGVHSARAAETVFGNGFAQSCYHAAKYGGEFSEGLADCDRAIEDEPMSTRDLSSTYVNRGVVYMGREDFADAERDFEQAIKIDASRGEAFVNLGAAMIGMRLYAGGITQIDKGLALGSEEPEKAYYNRAMADEGLDNETAAYFDYKKAAELKPAWTAPSVELTRFTVRPAP
jgi:tetratricopeptide (TPR) repeat protein